jgi:hypothetical protein
MDYKGEWGEGALDTPGPLNGTREASAIWAQECGGICKVHNVPIRYIKVDWHPAGILKGELAHSLQILPTNEKLGLEADKISQTLLTNRMQRKLQDH